MNFNEVVFIDIEVDPDSKKILDIGAIKGNGQEFHSKSISELSAFLSKSKYICGHNILKHDLLYLEKEIKDNNTKYQ